MSKLLSRKVLVPTGIIIVVLVILFLLPIPKVVSPEFSIAAEPVFEIAGLPITNTLLAAWLSMLVLIVGAWALTRKMKTVPGRGQGALEMIIEGMFGLVERATGPKWARKFFPIVMTIFLFVITSNWLGLTPLFGSWGPLHPKEEGQNVQWLNESHTFGLWVRAQPQQEGATPSTSEEAQTTGEGQGERYNLIPFFRAATTDLNVTVALALVSVGLTQFFGLKGLGISYFSKFLNLSGVKKAFFGRGIGCGGRIGAFFMGIIDLFIGVVEFISEIGKIVSFSFRLFGNIFAGEVLLLVMAFLIPYIASLPFYGLELFVGFVQALVFMMLTVAFFIVATTAHGAEDH